MEQITSETMINVLVSLQKQINELMDQIEGGKPKFFERPPMKVEVPDHYISVTEFSSKYKFLSCSQISKWIKEFPGYFNAVRDGTRLYINPFHVLHFMAMPPKDLKRSSRIYNSFHSLKEVVPALKTLYEEWQKISPGVRTIV